MKVLIATFLIAQPLNPAFASAAFAHQGGKVIATRSTSTNENQIHAYMNSNHLIRAATRELKKVLVGSGRFTGSCDDIDLKIQKSDTGPDFEITRYCAQDGDNFGGFTVKGKLDDKNVFLKDISFDYN